MDVNEWFEDAGDPGWIVVYVIAALVVLGVLAGIAMAGMRSKREHDRDRAREIRDQVGRRANRLRQHDAEARQLAAESEQARAEADRLEAEAEEKHAAFERERHEQEHRLREADEIDPSSRGRHQGDH